MLNIDVGGMKSRDPVEGWKILDILRSADYVYDLNSGKRFPFENGEVDYFYCSHTLEHVKPRRVQFVVNEFHRCLKRNGLIRIVVPDAEQAINWYLNNPGILKTKKGFPSKPKFYPETRMGRLLSWFYTEDRKVADGHSMGFDWELLCYYFHAAGFRRMDRFAYGNNSKIFNGKDKQRYRVSSIFAEMLK